MSEFDQGYTAQGYADQGYDQSGQQDQYDQGDQPTADQPSFDEDAAAARSLERRLRRNGILPDGVDADTADTADTADDYSDPAARGLTPRPAKDPSQAVTPEQRGFLTRERKRQERDAELATLREQQQITNRLLAMALQGQQPAPEKPAAPDPDTQPEEYLKHTIGTLLDERLGPLVQESQSAAELRQQQIERQQIEHQQRMVLQSAAEELSAAEEEYMTARPDAAAGYPERLSGYVQTSMAYYQSLGDSPERAYQLTTANLLNLANQAHQRGYNEAEFIDYHLRQALSRTQAPQNPTATRNRRLLQGAGRTANSNASRTLSQSTAGPDPNSPPVLLAGGKGSARAIREAAARAGKDPRQLQREMSRQILQDQS